MVITEVWKGAKNSRRCLKLSSKYMCPYQNPKERWSDLVLNTYIFSPVFRCPLVHRILPGPCWQSQFTPQSQIMSDSKWFSIVYGTRYITYIISNIVYNPRNMRLLIYLKKISHVFKRNLAKYYPQKLESHVSDRFWMISKQFCLKKERMAQHK